MSEKKLPIRFEWQKYDCEIMMWKDLIYHQDLDINDIRDVSFLPYMQSQVLCAYLDKPSNELTKVEMQLGNYENGINEFKALARLGYDYYISDAGNRKKILSEWIKKNGLPIYSSLMPFRKSPEITGIKGASPAGFTLHYAWLFTATLQAKCPHLFVMTDTALIDLALEASTVYLELYRRIKNRSSILACENPEQVYKHTGEEAFMGAKAEKEKIVSSKIDTLSTLLMILFKSSEWDSLKQILNGKKVATQHENETEYSNFFRKTLINVARSYRHHVEIDIIGNESSQLKRGGSNSLICPSNWLGLAWLEFYSLLTETNYSKLKICQNQACQTVFIASRSNKEYCSPSCQKNEAERQRRVGRK